MKSQTIDRALPMFQSKYLRPPSHSMSEVAEFFRICPACGRRFHIRLVSKKQVDDEKVTEETSKPTMNANPGRYSMIPIAPIVVDEDVPITVDVEDFQYSYKCKHCGHEWSETHTKVDE